MIFNITFIYKCLEVKIQHFLSSSHPNKFNTRKRRGRPRGRKSKTRGVCSGRIQLECTGCLVANKRQYCRKSKNSRKKSI
jgi:hypothetical protein